MDLDTEMLSTVQYGYERSVIYVMDIRCGTWALPASFLSSSLFLVFSCIAGWSSLIITASDSLATSWRPTFSLLSSATWGFPSSNVSLSFSFIALFCSLFAFFSFSLLFNLLLSFLRRVRSASKVSVRLASLSSSACLSPSNLCSRLFTCCLQKISWASSLPAMSSMTLSPGWWWGRMAACWPLRSASSCLRASTSSWRSGRCLRRAAPRCDKESHGTL